MLNSYGNYYDKRNKIEKGCRLEFLKNSIKTTNKCFDINESDLKPEFEIEHFSEISNKISSSLEELRNIKNLKFMNEDLFNEDEIQVMNNTINLLETKLDSIQSYKKKTSVKISFYNKVRQLYADYIRKELNTEKQSIELSKKTLDDDLIDYKEFFYAKMELKKACMSIEKLDKKVEDKINERDRYIFVTKLNFEINKNKIVEDLFVCSVLNYDKHKSIFDNLVLMADPLSDIRIKNKTGADGKKCDSFRKKVKEFVDSCRSKKQYEILEKGKLPGDVPVSTASTSQGRKASIFLDVKLNSFLDTTDKNILMIDQIEDNIDNKYISGNLVNILRKLKKHMQLILVTHNPSIAIYGDAENIIIAENEDNIIQYKQGGLENEEIRKEACKILDGGDIAFKNRMAKYNIEKIKF